MGKIKDISGKKFGRLLAVKLNGVRTIHGMEWECKCECGSIAHVVATRLITGHTRSCGCLQHEAAKLPKNVTHGHTRNSNKASSSEYHIWSSMKQRCGNPKNASYSRYGGRGISFDPKWSSYEAFFADMGARPSPSHTLDRIDGNGNYTKQNCRWATHLEQQNNRSGTRRIVFMGEALTSSELSRRHGISASVIRDRIDAGWTVERAVSTPVGNTGKRR